jgi:hypothetical protein
LRPDAENIGKALPPKRVPLYKLAGAAVSRLVQEAGNQEGRDRKDAGARETVWLIEDVHRCFVMPLFSELCYNATGG